MRRIVAGLGLAGFVACGEPQGPKLQAEEERPAPEPIEAPAHPAEAPTKPVSKPSSSHIGKLTVGVEYQVTSAGILEGERSLVELDEGSFPSSGPAFGAALDKLHSSLLESMTRARELASGFGADAPKGAIIRVDPQIPWDTLLTLVPAIERVGFSEFHVDVGSPDSAAPPIAFTLPSVLRSGEAAKTATPAGPLLAVEFAHPRSVYAWVPGGEREELVTEPRESLVASLAQVMAEHPKRKGLLVSASEDVGVAEVLDTLEKLIGVDCLRGTAVGCSVDHLYFVGGNAPGYDPEAQGPLAALTHSTGVWDMALTEAELGEGFGIGGLGLSAKGDSGAKYGVQSQDVGVIGRGVGFSHSARRGGHEGSRIRLALPHVQGKLAPEIVRRVLRRHFNELRFCYDKAQQVDEGLAGEVTLRFVIGLEGTVQASQVESATLKNTEVHACMVTANRRWAFPKPEGGIAVVKATFSFAPGNE